MYLYNAPVNKIALLLHLYQPLVQDEKTLRAIAENSYLPIVKTLKNKFKFKVTFSLPLSLVEQMDEYGYKNWIEDIKFLTEEGRVELVGGAAYHPLLTKLPDQVKQNQIILNEYGLGYYFGRRTGFEGEEAIMVKDLTGFFSPELTVNGDLNMFLSEFGYKWMLADPSSIKNSDKSSTCVFKFNDSKCLVVLRDSVLSNHLAFFRGLNVKPLLRQFIKKDSLVLVLDGETFGHHNKDGIYLLNKFIEQLSKEGKEFVTMSEFVNSQVSESKLEKAESIQESTWAYVNSKDPYYLWEGNEKQTYLQEIYNKLVEELVKINENFSNKYEGMENVAIWKEDNLPEDIKKKLFLNKILGSDPFWWLSGEKIAETHLYNPRIVKRFLEKYKEAAKLLENKKLEDFINKKVQEIEQSFK